MKTLKPRHALLIQTVIYLLFLFPLNLYSQEYFITESYFIRNIYSCDLDLDSDNDILISSSSNGLPDSLFIFYNDGIGNLNKTSIERRNGTFILCGNINDDQFPDIITRDASGIIYIENNGDGSFGEEILVAPNQINMEIKYITDMNGDGLNDMVYNSNVYYTIWGILENEGDLIFTDHIMYDDGMGGTLIPNVGMLNNDNLPDVCINYNLEGPHLLFNLGNITFYYDILCPTIAEVRICRLDTIPPEDILLFSNNTDELIFYENLGNNIFEEVNTIPLSGPVMVTDIADYNNDGYDDYSYALCWWTNCTDSIYISINDQQWNFHKPQRYYAGLMEHWFRTESADLNGDNYNEIVMYGYTPQNAFKILWNNGHGGFAYENPVGIRENLNPPKNLLVNINPNPFSSSSLVTIKSAINSHLKISIVDLYGRPVKHFNTVMINNNEPLEMNWDGKDDSGNDLKNGIYFLIVTDEKHNMSAIKILK